MRALTKKEAFAKLVAENNCHVQELFGRKDVVVLGDGEVPAKAMWAFDLANRGFTVVYKDVTGRYGQICNLANGGEHKVMNGDNFIY